LFVNFNLVITGEISSPRGRRPGIPRFFGRARAPSPAV
jgi:hypothetical protein